MKKIFLSLAFLSFFFNGVLYAQISVKCFGGAGRVSGSCHLLKTDDISVIVDCGSFYEEADLPADNSVVESPLINAGAMVLTHAHTDHSGRIPLLISEGYSGKIYCTQATKKILFEMFDDGWNHFDVKQKYFWSYNSRERIQSINRGILTVHWYDDCQKKIKNIESTDEKISVNKLKEKYKINIKLCKKCLKKDLQKTEEHFVTAEYGDKIKITDKINFVLYDAGHITGSASVFFNIYDENKIKKVSFSGDLGSGLSKITPDKDIIPKADFVFIESTYGAGGKTISYADYDRFQNAVADALKNNKIVWIPALSLHRTQKILYEIKQAQQKGLISKDIPVFALSPSSNGITEQYEKELKYPSGIKWFKDEVYKTGSFLPANYITKKPKFFQEPCIIISASGMMDQGVSYSLIKKLLPLENVEVFLVSYASPKTPAGKLKRGAKYIRTRYGTARVNAKINIFDIFSDHADSTELLKWLSNQDALTHLYLIHGEKAILNKSQKLYKSKGFNYTDIAVIGNQVLK